MKIFKNFQTKKQLQEENARLQEENARLKAMLSIPTQIHTVERNVQKVGASFCVPFEERYIPDEIIKREIARNMIEYLQPLINYDFEDDGRGRIYRGTLYVAIGD